MSVILKKIKNQKMLIVLLAFFIIMCFAAPNFFSVINIVNLFTQIAIYGVIACGVVFVMLCGEFDISVGSVMAMSGVICASILNRIGGALGYTIVALTLLGSAFIIGTIYGLLITKIKINSFIVTLGGMMFYRGIGYFISDGNPVPCKEPSFINISNTSFLRIPSTVWIFLLLVIIMELILKKTRYGRNIFATGGNKEVAQYSGINVDFYKISAYIISAAGAVFAGLLIASRLGTAAPNHGEDAALSVISGLVLGGVSLSGGEGGMVKGFIGLMILGLVTNALNMIGVYSYYQLAIKGLLLIIIVGTERYYKKLEAES